MTLCTNILFFITCFIAFFTTAQERTLPMNLSVATFNVSMEALNYVPYVKGKERTVHGNELLQALRSDHQQIKNIAEIIQKINPDIILLNEFDYSEDNAAIELFINDYLNKPQQQEKSIHYPYYYKAPVNTGVNMPLSSQEANGDKAIPQFGFGHFPGHFGMLLLSKYPIDIGNIRTFQHFKWKDMPHALQPINPENNQPWYSEAVWNIFRLSSKSHWDVPIKVAGKKIHILASHPTPPVFDGKEDRNGRRNHDEIRFWSDYISPDKSHYIYDDNGAKGGIKGSSPFIILGDLNASAIEGDAINSGIEALLNNTKINDTKPQSLGAKNHSQNNEHGSYHTAFWRMRADYVLPSTLGFNVIDSGVFWPDEKSADWRLIKNRQSSSDHRLVWVELSLNDHTEKK